MPVPAALAEPGGLAAAHPARGDHDRPAGRARPRRRRHRRDLPAQDRSTARLDAQLDEAASRARPRGSAGNGGRPHDRNRQSPPGVSEQLDLRRLGPPGPRPARVTDQRRRRGRPARPRTTTSPTSSQTSPPDQRRPTRWRCPADGDAHRRRPRRARRLPGHRDQPRPTAASIITAHAAGRHPGDPAAGRPGHRRRRCCSRCSPPAGPARSSSAAPCAPLNRVAATATRVSELELDRGEVELAQRVPAADTDPRTEVGAGRRGAQPDARPRRQRARGAARQRDAGTPVRRRRQPRAAHPAGRDPRLRRAEPAQPRSRSRRRSRHVLRRVESEAKRMTALVEDLLLLARLDAGRPLAQDPVDLTMLVVDAVSDAHAAGPRHDWQLDLPEEPVTVTGDGAAAASGAGESAGQRAYAHPGGHHRDGRGERDRRRGRAAGDRRRAGHPGRAAAAHLRAVRPRATARGPGRPAAPAWACRSCTRWSPRTAARSSVQSRPGPDRVHRTAACRAVLSGPQRGCRPSARRADRPVAARAASPSLTCNSSGTDSRSRPTITSRARQGPPGQLAGHVRAARPRQQPGVQPGPARGAGQAGGDRRRSR